VRSKLSDLRNKITGNDKLEELLDAVVRDTEKLKQISAQNQGKEE
jgi:type VI secretion system protein ImpB